MHTTTTLSTLLITATTATASFCTTFQVVPQTYSERGSTTPNLTNLTTSALYDYRISPAIICNDTAAAAPASADCLPGTCQPPITNGTVVSQTGVANLTLSDEDKATLFSLISEAADIPFLVEANTTLGAPNAEQFNTCVSPTWAGYLTFTPLLNCVNGLLSGCGADSTVTDGTAVRACAPMAPQGQLRGGIFFEQTSDETANAVGAVPSPVVAEQEVFVGTYRSPVPVPTSFVATAVPGAPGQVAVATPGVGH